MSPFTDNPAESLAALGEVELISRIRDWLGAANPPAPAGIGDDCAVLPDSPVPNLVTVDPVVYGRHFDDATPPALAGAKLIKRNLSDIAAMGGQPTSGVLALAAGSNVSLVWLEAFIRGLAGTCIEFSTTIVGGDIAELPAGQFVGTLTLLGHAERKLLRTGTQLGDRILVTGALGGSIASKHLDFTPRIAEGLWLAGRSEVTAMMDLTDGLAKDLPAMLTAGTCAMLETASIPIAPAAEDLATHSGKPAAEHAFCDGEDYELLFMVKGDANLDALLADWIETFTTPLCCIGKIDTVKQASQNRRLINTASGELLYPDGGYQHLKRHD